MTRKGSNWFVALIFSGLLSACGGGGGGGGSGGGNPTPAPSGLSYPAPPAFVINQAIASLSPTVTGTVTSYSVSPALPTGLSLNSSTGVISGTPTAVSSAKSYTVQAGNSTGNTTATISLTVNDVAPVISYGATSFPISTQKSVNITPTSTGGAVVTWSINPALPTGLTFSTSNGSITGTPAAAVASANYVVTAQNTGGTTTANLTLSPQSVLLNLGHHAPVTLVRMSSSRVLSEDSTHAWVLWNSATGEIVATGKADCLRAPNAHRSCEPQLDIAGSIIIVEQRGALEIRSATNATVVATLSDASLDWWKLAADGSYIVAGGDNGLTAWSPTGAVLFSKAGSYTGASIIAALGEVRVGLGAAGASVIERIAVPAGTSVTGPAFQGQFHSWFADGGRFLTHVGNTIWVYALDGTQEDIKILPALPNLGGLGNYFWTSDGSNITLYKVGASATPAGSSPVGTNTLYATPATMTVAALESSLTGGVRIIDLSGATPVFTNYVFPSGHGFEAYAALSSSQWFMGSADGLLIDGASYGGTPRYFGYGRVSSIVGGASGRVVIRTAVGKTLFFDAVAGTSEGSINTVNDRLALSDDGSVLVTTQFNVQSTTTEVYSLPAGTLTYSWSPARVYPFSFSLSRSGTALAQFRETNCTPCTLTIQVTSPTGGAVLWSGNSSAESVRLSPNGTLVADPGARHSAVTNIYLNGALSSAVTGWAVGWLDDSHLLVQNYAGGDSYVSSAIYSPGGTKLSTPAARDVGDAFQIVDSDSIYDVDENAIYRVSTGAKIWSTATPSAEVGAVAGSRVVFVSGNELVSEGF
jgi:hypothetical protein